MPVTGAGELYGLPLDRFVAERTALAKALRGCGQREQAAEVAALRKPTVAAWAVNQLVRTQAAAIAALVEVGDALSQAQAGLLAGDGDARRLRDAGARERVAVEQLTQTARGLLSSAGHELTQPTLDRVAETLHAAALDPGARRQVLGGQLEHELRHVGLGEAGLAEVVPAKVGRPRGRPTQEPAERASVEREQAEREEHAGHERAERERVEREREEQAERQRVARLAAARDAEAAAGRDAERHAEELRAAEEALAVAQRRADESAAAHRRARDELLALEGQPLPAVSARTRSRATRG